MRQPYNEDGEVSAALAYPDRGMPEDFIGDEVCERLGTAQAARLWADGLMHSQSLEGS